MIYMLWKHTEHVAKLLRSCIIDFARWKVDLFIDSSMRPLVMLMCDFNFCFR